MIAQALADAGAAPEASLMIGDTSYDMAMARAAGVTAVGVAWGYHAPDELVRAGAHHVAHHPRDIAELVKGNSDEGISIVRSENASSKGSLP
jgi:phosphoglycolate phosphatase